MEVIVRGEGKVRLDKRHYISSGGEGKIYAKDSTAYKIYHEPSKVIPEAKINDFEALTNSNIIKPVCMILNSKDEPIGYTMRYVADTVALCQLFTKAFRDRNNIKGADIIELVTQLQDMVQHCHDHNILIVDMNELNFLVGSSKFDTLYGIDVDSYQTPHYPATAIMDSIKDMHATSWTVGSDWFSFAILTFQLFTGIHPYKGTHPTYQGLDDRMLNNISVFNKDVSVPAVALPVDVIPAAYKQWYSDTFEQGARGLPPIGDIAVVAIPVKIQVLVGNDNFIIVLVKEYDGNIISCTTKSILTEKGLYIGDTLDATVAPYAHVAVTPKLNHTITFIIKDGQLLAYDGSRHVELMRDTPLLVTRLMTYNNRVYAQCQDKIFEIVYTEMNHDQIFVSLHAVCSVLSQATQLFDGVIIQDVIGMYIISIFPESKKHYQIKIPELAGHRIIDAKYDNKILVVVGEYKGAYNQYIIKFNDTYSEYSVRKVEGVQHVGINFTVLDKGICMLENHEGHIELFHNNKDSMDVKVIKDTTLSGSKLFHKDNDVLIARGNSMYSVKMK